MILSESGMLDAFARDRDQERGRRKRQRLEQFVLFLERRGLQGEAGLNELALMSREDGEESDDSVLLSTIHAAKGLEFAVVYVAGLEEGILPHDHALAEGQLEEERRLLYVAITRAREHLILSRAEMRRAGGTWSRSEPSRFLAEIPAALLREGNPEPSSAAAEAAWHRERIRQLLAADAPS